MKATAFALYWIVFIVCAIQPYDRAVWFAENIPILILILGVYGVSRYHTFSRLSWILMFVLPILHTIGGHYTFERVPFDWVSDIFGFERNHYDRLAHFSVGFYAFAIAELLEAKRLVNKRIVASLFGAFAIFTVAASYEILEWWYALSADPEAGLAVLGSQGDIWDAQKDMLADALGAIIAVIAYHMSRGKDR
ncbi:DUF2238 domain-containing protein [Coraliomargarita sp. W4R53]